MKSNERIRSQLLLAENENTSPEDLDQIWTYNTSIKVRKAVAKNPNASPYVLRKAARLYLEEVLSNPAFEMMELFDDDPWLRMISECYSNPAAVFLQHYNPFLYVGTSRTSPVEIDKFCWACLLSPEITPNILNSVLKLISSEMLKRALKNKNTLNKLRNICKFHLSTIDNSLISTDSIFDLESFLLLHKVSIIDDDQLYEALKSYGVASTSCCKSSYKKFVSKLIKEYVSTENENIPKILSRLFLISRRHTVNWVRDLFFFTGKNYQQLVSDEVVKLSAKIISYMSNVEEKFIGRSNANSSSIKMVLVSYLKNKFFKNKPYDFESAFFFLKENGISDKKLSLDGLNFCEQEEIKELSRHPLEIKKAFISMGCLGEWACISEGDSRYHLINSINEEIYREYGVCEELIFNSCSLKKVIPISSSVRIF